MTSILVTRPAGQAAKLVGLLAAAGFEAIAVPTVAIEPVEPDALRSALARGPDWLVVTSANGAAVLGGAAIPDGTRVAAVGPATAVALSARGVRVDHVPDRYLTVAIAHGLGDLRGRHVLLARAASATRALREALHTRGATVEEVVAYRTVEAPSGARPQLRSALGRPLDGVAFTSGSTVRGFVRLLGGEGLESVRQLPAFCIGPVTAAVAGAAGLNVAGIADEHTASGLVTVIARHFEPVTT
jgi:uroporphyrinogen III methyltransferase / synthase